MPKHPVREVPNCLLAANMQLPPTKKTHPSANRSYRARHRYPENAVSLPARSCLAQFPTPPQPHVGFCACGTQGREWCRRGILYVLVYLESSQHAPYNVPAWPGPGWPKVGQFVARQKAIHRRNEHLLSHPRTAGWCVCLFGSWPAYPDGVSWRSRKSLARTGIAPQC